MEIALDEFRKRLLDPRPLVDPRRLECAAEPNLRPVENAGTAVLASFEPLAGLIDELSGLAASFHRVREFTEQVRIASADRGPRPGCRDCRISQHCRPAVVVKRSTLAQSRSRQPS